MRIASLFCIIVFCLGFLFSASVVCGQLTKEDGQDFLMAVCHGKKELIVTILEKHKDELRELLNYQDPVTGDTACTLLAQGVLRSGKSKRNPEEFQQQILRQLLDYTDLDLTIADNCNIDALGYLLACENLDLFSMVMPYVTLEMCIKNITFAFSIKNAHVRDSVLRVLLKKIPTECNDTFVVQARNEVQFPPLEILKK